MFLSWQYAWKRKKERNKDIFYYFFSPSYILSNWKPVMYAVIYLNNSRCSDIRQPLFVKMIHVCCIKCIVARFVNSCLCCFNQRDTYLQIKFAGVQVICLFFALLIHHEVPFQVIYIWQPSFLVICLIILFSGFYNSYTSFICLCHLYLHLDLFGAQKHLFCAHITFCITCVLYFIHIMAWNIYWIRSFHSCMNVLLSVFVL
jgi:hypothetical protein